VEGGLSGWSPVVLLVLLMEAKMNDQERIRAYREHIPNLHDGAYRRGYDKAMKGKSLRAAVNAQRQVPRLRLLAKKRGTGLPRSHLPFVALQAVSSLPLTSHSARQRDRGAGVTVLTGGIGRATVSKGDRPRTTPSRG